MTHRKIPKPKKGAWYVKVRGSYLPCSWQGWAMHVLLIALCVMSFFAARENNKHILGFIFTTAIYFYALGAVFTAIARKKS